MAEDFTLTIAEQASIPIPDLALILLRILRRNLSTGLPDRRRVNLYEPNQIPMICEIELQGDRNQRDVPKHPGFRARCAEAASYLRERGWIRPDPKYPGTSEFFLVTDEGWAVDLPPDGS